MTSSVPSFAGAVPVVGDSLSPRDRLGAWRVRWSIRRSHYRVDPGLYAVGAPNDRAPVLVTANYKLSFDALRSQLGGRDAWILVLDTRGVNVWCAAGKGTFSTDELCRQMDGAALPMVVSHGVVVLPQLGAPGVAAPEVKRRTGFRVIYGPVRASDLPNFLDAGMRATPEMRRVTFTLRDRLVLAPVELAPVLGVALVLLAAATAIAGFGPDLFSVARALQAVGPATALLLVTLVAGSVITPLLLPWVPGRMFSVKGAVVGTALVAILLPFLLGTLSPVRLAAGAALIVAGSSYAAMNFTGSTTFTSLSGVLHEMRKSLPWQVGGAAAALLLWIVGGFL